MGSNRPLDRLTSTSYQRILKFAAKHGLIDLCNLAEHGLISVP